MGENKKPSLLLAIGGKGVNMIDLLKKNMQKEMEGEKKNGTIFRSTK